MNLNILHENCGSGVYLLLNDFFSILCTFGIGNKSVKPSLGNIEVIKAGLNDAKYFCANCRIEVSVDELTGICSWCGCAYPVEKLFRHLNNSGKSTGDIACQDCINKYEITVPAQTSLKDTLSKVFIS